ncbi:zeta toxin family protein [Nocardia miyunensis]|uniref:zeta toxin family protein n=1 Tax=Nocardia miyunensis TaxID=282684 RepID=UPI001470E9F5|nr:zeta toxin family protein [Nocardia miyunensis]
MHIPPGFPSWLVDMVLGHLPVGDPDAMRRDADSWVAAAHRLGETQQRLETLRAGHAATAIEGATGETIRKQLDQQIADTKSQIALCNSNAERLYEAANSLEFTQYVIIGMGAALLVQLAVDIASFMAAKTVADRIAADTAMKLSARDLLKWLRQQVIRFAVEHPHLSLVVRGVGLGALTGGAVNVGAQVAQIVQGHRTSIDWNSAGVATAAGAAGGLVGAEVGRVVAPAVSRIGANSASKFLRVGGHVLGTVIAGAAGGAAGGVAGGVTAAVLTGQPLRSSNLAEMALAGAGAGYISAAGAAMRTGRAAATAVPRAGAESGAGVPTDPVVSARDPQVTGDGQVPRPDGLTPEMMAMGDEIARKVAEDLPAGPEADALAEFVDGKGSGDLHQQIAEYLRQQGDSGDSGSAGSSKDTGGQPGSTRPSSPTSSAPWRGEGSPVTHGGGGSAHVGGQGTRRVVATTDLAGSPGHGSPAGRSGLPERITVQANADGAGPPAPLEAPTAHADSGVTHPDSAPVKAEPGAAESSQTTGSHGAGDGGQVDGGHDGPTASEHGGEPGGPSEHSVPQDHSTPGDENPPGPDAGQGDGPTSADDGGGHFVPADDGGGGPSHCVPYAVNKIHELTGLEVDPAALGDDAATAGVGGRQAAQAVGGGWRPGGVDSPKALVDEVRTKGGAALMGVQRSGTGAHAAVVTRNAEGGIEIYERIGDVARKVSGNEVVEWILDENGQPILEMSTEVDDAVGHWLNDLDADKTYAIVFEVDQAGHTGTDPGGLATRQNVHPDGRLVPQVKLDSETGSGARPELDMPRDNMRGAAVLERPSTGVRRPALDLDFDTEFQQLTTQFDGESPAAPMSRDAASAPEYTDALTDGSAPHETLSTPDAQEATSTAGDTAPSALDPVAQPISSAPQPDATSSAHPLDETATPHPDATSPAHPPGETATPHPAATSPTHPTSETAAPHAQPDTPNSPTVTPQQTATTQTPHAGAVPPGNSTGASLLAAQQNSPGPTAGFAHAGGTQALHPGLTAGTLSGAEAAAVMNDRPGIGFGEGDDVPPEEITFPKGDEIATRVPGHIANPTLDGVPDLPMPDDAPEEIGFGQSDYIVIPGVSGPPEPESDREITPIVPKLPWAPADRPAEVTGIGQPGTLDPTADPGKPANTRPAEYTPLPEYDASPPTHLPALPAKEPPQKVIPDHFTPPLDKDARDAPQPPGPPRLNPDDPNPGRIPDESGIPGPERIPTRQLAPPPPAPVVPIRPVPWASASAGGSGRRRKKTPPEPPTPPQDPAPSIPMASDAAKPPAKDQPAGDRGADEIDRATADLAELIGVSPQLIQRSPAAVRQAIKLVEDRLREKAAEDRDRAERSTRPEQLAQDIALVPAWIGRSVAHDVAVQDATAGRPAPPHDELRRTATQLEELLTALGPQEPSPEWLAPVSADPLHELRRVGRRPDAPPDLVRLVETATRFFGLRTVAAAVEPVHPVLDGWPNPEQADLAVAIAWDLARQLPAPQRATAEIHGEQGNRWVSIEVTGTTRDLPVRPGATAPAWPAVESLDDLEWPWGFTLGRSAGLTVGFRFSESGGVEDPSLENSDPAISLHFSPDTLPIAPRTARHRLRRLETEAGVPAEHIDDALLVVSELLQNVLRHAPGDADLRVRTTGGTLRVEVSDHSPNLPFRQPGSIGASEEDLLEEHGYAFGLWENLASAWGVDARPDGKTVWAEFRGDGPDPADQSSSNPPGQPSEPANPTSSQPKTSSSPVPGAPGHNAPTPGPTVSLHDPLAETGLGPQRPRRANPRVGGPGFAGIPAGGVAFHHDPDNPHNQWAAAPPREQQKQKPPGPSPAASAEPRATASSSPPQNAKTAAAQEDSAQNGRASTPWSADTTGGRSGTSAAPGRKPTPEDVKNARARRLERERLAAQAAHPPTDPPAAGSATPTPGVAAATGQDAATVPPGGANPVAAQQETPPNTLAADDSPSETGWRTLTMQREVPLSNWSYNREQSLAVARWMLQRLRDVVLPGLHPDATPEQIDDAFYSDKEIESGMVLRTVSLDELLADGNLRELNAALLNATDRNTRSGNPAGTTLNEGLARLLDQPDDVLEATARRLGMDVEMLRRARASIHDKIAAERPGTPITANDMRAVKHWVAPGAESSLAEYTRSHVYEPADSPERDAQMLRRHLLLHDLALLGKALSRRELEAFQSLRLLRKERLDSGRALPRDEQGRVDVPALEAELRAEDPTLRYALPLYEYDEHDRDRRVTDTDGNAVVYRVLAFYDEGSIDPATALRFDGPDHDYVVELPLRPGVVLQHLGSDDPWFLETAVRRGFPLAAGISGAAARLGSAALLLYNSGESAPGDISPDDVAAMLIGFIEREHHTLYETLHGLRLAGIPVIDDADYATPESMYSAAERWAGQLGYPKSAWRQKYTVSASFHAGSRGADVPSAGAAPSDPRLAHATGTRAGSGRRGPQPAPGMDGSKASPPQGVSGEQAPAEVFAETVTPQPNDVSTDRPDTSTTTEAADTGRNNCAVVMLQDLHAAGVAVREPAPAEIGPAGMPLVGSDGLEDRMPHLENGDPNQFQEIPLDPDSAHSVDEIIAWVDQHLQPHARQVAVVVEFAPEDQATVTLPDGNREKVGGHGFLINADPHTNDNLPHGDPRRVVRAFVLAFDNDNHPTALPDAVPRAPVSPRFRVGRPADSNPPEDGDQRNGPKSTPPQQNPAHAASAPPSQRTVGPATGGTASMPSALAPNELRALEAAKEEAAEIVAEALRPARLLGMDTTGLHQKNPAEIEEAIDDLEALQQRRLTAVLRRLVVDALAARVLGDEKPTSEVREYYELLKPHIKAAQDYVGEVRTALAMLAARQVLAAEGADSIAEGIGEVPGQCIVVASPLVGQEQLVDALAPTLRERAVREGLPIRYRQVLVDEDGRLSVRRVSGTPAEPEPHLWNYADSEYIAWLNDFTDERPFAEKLAAARASGEKSRKVLKENSNNESMSEKVVLVFYENDYRAVEKTVRTEDHADGEDLGAKTLRKIGVPAPETVRLRELGEPGEFGELGDRVVFIEYVPGIDAKDVPGAGGSDAWPMFFHTPGGRRMGFGDMLLGPPDRHEGSNWRLQHRFRIRPLDNSNIHTNSYSFGMWPEEGFTTHFVQWKNGCPEWVEHDVSRTEFEAYRQAVSEVETDYDHLNKQFWHRTMTRILRFIEKNVKDESAPPIPALGKVMEILEELRGIIADQLRIFEPHDIATHRDWRREISYLRQFYVDNPDPVMAEYVELLDGLLKLHLAARMKRVSIDDLVDAGFETIFPAESSENRLGRLGGGRTEVVDSYLDNLSLRLDDLAVGAKYPAPNNESDEDWQSRFDREIRATAPRAAAPHDPPPGPTTQFHHFDQRAALDLPQPKNHRRFGAAGFAGIPEGGVAFHNRDGIPWDAPKPRASNNGAPQQNSPTIPPEPAVDLDNLRAVRNAVATELAHVTADQAHAVVAQHELEQPLALLNELLAVQQGAHAPGTAEQLNLLMDFVHAVDFALAPLAETSLRDTNRALAAIAKELQAAPTGPQVRARDTDLVTGVDQRQLLQVWEGATQQMVQAGFDVDEADPRNAADVRATTEHYGKLIRVVGLLEDFLSCVQTPDGMVTPGRLRLLRDNFTTTAAWLVHNAAAAGEMDRTAAAVVTAFRAAGREFHDLAAALIAVHGIPAGPGQAAVHEVPPQTQVTWPEPQAPAAPQPPQAPTAPDDRAAQSETSSAPEQSNPEPAHGRQSGPDPHVEQDDGGSLAAVSDVGLRHETNEDAFATGVVDVAGTPVQVAVVCDGRSSSAQAHRAARAAADAARDDMVAALTAPAVRATGRFDPVEIAQRGTAAAKNAVRALATLPEFADLPEEEYPDCTIVSAVVEPERGQATLDWEGDSRGYRLSLRPGDSERVTEDDSMLTMLMRRLGMSEAEAMRDPRAHMISRSLSIPSAEESHAKTIPLPPGDFLLLCTDGMWNDTFEAESLADIVRRSWEESGSLLSAVRALEGQALANGGHDNITGVLVRIAPRGHDAGPLDAASELGNRAAPGGSRERPPGPMVSLRNAADPAVELGLRDKRRERAPRFGAEHGLAADPHLGFLDNNGTPWGTAAPGTAPAKPEAADTEPAELEQLLEQPVSPLEQSSPPREGTTPWSQSGGESSAAAPASSGGEKGEAHPKSPASEPDTDVLAPERYEVADDQAEATFREKVIPAVFGEEVPGRADIRVLDDQEFLIGLPDPVLRVLGGQPGAAKSTVLPSIVQDFARRGGVVYIGTIDTFLRFHPRYEELMALDDTATGLLMDFAWQLQQKAIDHAIALRCNVLLEQTLTNTRGVGATLSRFTGAHFTVELDVIAVQPHVSKHRTVMRYVEGRLSGDRRVLTPAQAHDDAVPGSAATVAELESADARVRIEAVRVLGVDGETYETYYDNHRTANGEWAKQPKAADTLQDRRNRPLTPGERRAIARRASKNYDAILARIATDPNAAGWQELRLLASGPEVAMPWLARGFDRPDDVEGVGDDDPVANRPGDRTDGPVHGMIDTVTTTLVDLLGARPRLRQGSRDGISHTEITLSGERGDATYLVLTSDGASNREQLLTVMPAPNADRATFGPALRRVLSSMLDGYDDMSRISANAALLLTRTPQSPHTYAKWEVWVDAAADPGLLRITIHHDRGAPVLEREYRLGRRGTGTGRDQ